MKSCKRYCYVFVFMVTLILFSKNALAEEKSFVCTKMEFEEPIGDYASMGVHNIYIDSKNRLQYFHFGERNQGNKYLYTLIDSKNNENGKLINKKIVSVKKTPQIVKYTDDNKIIMVFRNYGSKKMFQVNILDKKSKKTAAFKYTFNKSVKWFYMADVYVVNNKIYYAYVLTKKHTAEHILYLECRNLKNNKLISKNIICKTKSNEEALDSVKILDGKLYIMNKENIISFSLKGKSKKIYYLPDNGMYIEASSDAELISKEFSKQGNYIYYCNKKGIYRCNCKNNTGFELYYDATGDKFFSANYGFNDMTVDNNGDVYLALVSKAWEDIGYTTDIVRYSRLLE